MVVSSDPALFAEAMQLYRLVFTDGRPPLAKFHRALGVVRARILFRGAQRGVRVNATGHVQVVAGGRIKLGDQVQFFGGMIPSRVVCRYGGQLTIDAFTGFNYGVSIECARSISIGRRCMFGSMSCVRDTAKDTAGPVVIEDDVWVAHGAMIEPGVRIGAGSVVAAGSVVIADVPANSLALGNPARSIGLDLVRAGAQTRP